PVPFFDVDFVEGACSFPDWQVDDDGPVGVHVGHGFVSVAVPHVGCVGVDGELDGVFGHAVTDDVFAGFEVGDDFRSVGGDTGVEEPVELPGDAVFGEDDDAFHVVGVDGEMVVDEGLAVGVDVGSPLVGDVEVFAAVDPFDDAVEGGAEVGAGAGFGGLFRGFN